MRFGNVILDWGLETRHYQQRQHRHVARYAVQSAARDPRVESHSERRVDAKRNLCHMKATYAGHFAKQDLKMLKFEKKKSWKTSQISSEKYP